jgi:extracellular elastinolytic metalloproteinase
MALTAALLAPGTVTPPGAGTTPGAATQGPTPIATPATLAARAALATTIGPGAVLEAERPQDAVRWLANLNGTLTGPSALTPQEVALGYVAAHRDAFGLSTHDLGLLQFRGDYVDIGGTHHVSWVERAGRVPIFGAGLKAAVAADGSLISLAGPIYHVVRLAAPDTPQLDAGAAIRAARAAAGGTAGSSVATTMPRDRASLVRYAAMGTTGLAWDTVVAVGPARVLRSVIDAATGRVLWRENLVRADTTGSGLAWPEAPGPFPHGGGDQVPVSFPVAGPAALSGNDAHVYTAVSGSEELVPADEVPALDPSTMSWGQPPVLDTTTESQNCTPTYPCSWDYTTPYSWKANRRQEAVQAYYLLNAYHDHLAAAPIGFTEAAGNFQVTNAGGKGKGGDPVIATTLVGANLGRDGRPRILNNATMYTPPDGTPGRMSLYLFRRDRAHPEAPTADAADDATVVFHEYTHGMSGRLVTMPDGTEALYGSQSGAMSEGWSDWYALDDLVANGYQPDSGAVDVPVGVWISGGVGERPQFADCLPASRGPACDAPKRGSAGAGGFTYGDYGHIAGVPEAHADGEIWLQTLWQLRSVLGSPATESLVTRAMELSPQAPTFLEERDAILIADAVVFGGAHHDQIWRVFARRGMGFFASSGSTFDTRPIQSFSMPVSCPGDGCGALVGQVVDPTTGAPVAGALVHLAADQIGVPVDLSAVTGPKGRFRIVDVPDGPYRAVHVSANGYRTVELGPVRVEGDTRLHPTVRRDWLLRSGGARIVGFTGPDRTTTTGECGPRGAVDGSLATSWLTSIAQPVSITIELPTAVNVTQFLVDPSARCAGADSDALALRILTRTEHGRWRTSAAVSQQLPPGHLSILRPSSGWRDVRFVRLVLRSAARSNHQVEFTELVVHGVPSAAA